MPLHSTSGLRASLVATAGGLRSPSEHRLLGDLGEGPEGASLTVRQPGGELNGLAVNYHVPTFVTGEEYVLFMPEPSKIGLASPVGICHGISGAMRRE